MRYLTNVPSSLNTVSNSVGKKKAAPGKSGLFCNLCEAYRKMYFRMNSTARMYIMKLSSFFLPQSMLRST